MNTLRRDKLIWSDEFDGPSGTPPNPSWWIHEIGDHGWGNGELQCYTDQPANSAHDGQGNLIIRAIKAHDGFTSARLITKGLVEVKYGRLECRLLLPKGRGLWSAVWMLGANIDDAPWPACGEIDVIESLGAEPNRAFGTVHCPGHFGRGGISGDYICSEELADDFRVFAVEWLPDRISWSIDGAKYFSVYRDQLGPSWAFDHAFYILMNLAVGGSLGGGKVGDESVFPAELWIDYIRVYAIRNAQCG